MGTGKIWGLETTLKVRGPDQLTGQPALLFIASIAGRKRSTGALGNRKLDVAAVAEGVQRLDR